MPHGLAHAADHPLERRGRDARPLAVVDLDQAHTPEFCMASRIDGRPTA